MLTHASDPSPGQSSNPPAQPSHEPPPPSAGLGSLQLRIMHLIWAMGTMTVYDVAKALDAQPDAPRLAYTTYLTVMRNLVRRGILAQERVGVEKAHRFSARIGERDFKCEFLRQICKDYCASDAKRMMGYLHLEP